MRHITPQTPHAAGRDHGLARLAHALIAAAVLFASAGCGSEEHIEARTPQTAALIKQLQEGKPEEREQAIDALATVDDPAVVAPLVAAARTDTQRHLRIAAIRALRRPALVTSAEPLYPLLKDPEGEVRAVTCETLAALKPASAEAPLAECLSDRESIVRSAAIQALSLLGPSARARVEPLLDNGPVEDRLAVISVIGETGDKERVPRLVTLLRADDDAVRQAVIDALGKLADDRAVPALVELIRNPLSASKRKEFVDRKTAPLTIADRNAIVAELDEILIEQGQAPKGPKEHQWAMKGDSSAHRSVFERVLARQEKTAETAMRVHAAEALVRIGTPPARDALMALLADEDAGIGKAVARSLASGAGNREPLIALLRDPARPGVARQRALDLLVADAKAPATDISTEVMLKGMAGGSEDVVVRVGPGSGDFIRITALAENVKEALIHVLADKDLTIRSTAAVELGKRKVPEALEPLLALLSTSDRATRQKAVRCLANYSDPRAVEPLLAMLKSESDPATRAAVATALGAAKDKRATSALLDLARIWQDSQPQPAALQALAAIADPAAGPPLYAIYKESERRLAEANANRTEPRRGPGTAGHQNYIRRLVIDALGACQSKDAIPDLMALITRHDATRGDDTEETAWVALARLGETRAIPTISTRLLNGPHRKKLERNVNWTTENGTQALGIFNDARGVPTLEKLVRTPPDGPTREYAARALGKIHQPEAVDALLRMLVDPGVELAVKETDLAPAIAANAKLARPQLARMLVEAPEPAQGNRFDPGIYAAQFLAAMGPEALPDFRAAAASDKRHVLARVVEGVGRIADDRAVEILAGLLKSKDAAVRQWAAVALGRSRQPAAVAVLRTALNDPEAEVVRWTKWALEQHGVTP